MPTTKPLHQITNLDAYATSRMMLIKSTAKVEGENDIGIEVPIAIVYRFYHLGRAYDFQAIKLLKPEGSVLISYVNSQLLIAELEKLPSLVNDPVVVHYLALLLPYMKSKRALTRNGFLLSLN